MFMMTAQVIKTKLSSSGFTIQHRLPVCGGLWRFACISLVSQILVVICGALGLRWFVVVCGHLRWFVVVCGDLWWFAVVCHLLVLVIPDSYTTWPRPESKRPMKLIRVPTALPLALIPSSHRPMTMNVMSFRLPGIYTSIIIIYSQQSQDPNHTHWQRRQDSHTHWLTEITLSRARPSPSRPGPGLPASQAQPGQFRQKCKWLASAVAELCLWLCRLWLWLDRRIC